MTELDIYHNKIRCPYCKDGFMQFEFVIPQKNDNGSVDLEFFMSCEKRAEKRCDGRMRINANASKVETWESLKQA